MEPISLIDGRMPIWAIFKRSYGYVWENRNRFMVPILVVFLVNLAGTVGPATILEPAKITFGSMFLGWGFLLGNWFVSMAFAVGIHRAVLLDEVRCGIAVLRWDRNLLRFFGTVLLLGLLFVLFGLASSAVLGLVLGIVFPVGRTGAAPLIGVLLGGPLAVWFVAILVLQRLLLSLPAAAIGKPGGVVLSWRATRGNWLRLIAVSDLTILPPAVLGLLFSVRNLGEAIKTGSFPLSPTDTSSLVVSVIHSALVATTIPIIAVMFSRSYDVLVRGGGPMGPTTSRPIAGQN
ncbi:hypothetical protein [Telmatospirillum sp.]|uniref:hypothetical protein n=1 Tax=Telmatospirillum sp. TaxID=2079197 RepID=UPI00284E72C6|nr:hypothetical protein [Telmatospirillum sp.]MDR3437295.1 hypothetical protein [Telmatospirillum sp.]